MALVQLTIDGSPVEVEAGTTILRAAERLGIKIPTLCYLEGLHEIGACRVCVRSEERRVGKECRSRWSPYH